MEAEQKETPIDGDKLADLIIKEGKQFSSNLIERFPQIRGVKIFFTYMEDGEAYSANTGKGDAYSMDGAIKAWLIRVDERYKKMVSNENEDAEDSPCQ